MPIITVTRNYNTSRTCHLYRGVYPCLYPQSRPTDPTIWQEDVDTRLHWAMQYIPVNTVINPSQAQKLHLLEPGDVVVAIQGWRGGLGNSNTLRVPRSLDLVLTIDFASSERNTLKRIRMNEGS